IMLELFADQWVISYTFPLAPTAEFVFSEIEVTNKDTGEVSITVAVTNTGGQSGSVSVPLKINQTTEDEKTVTLDAGQSTTVEFIVTKNPGTYIAEINGESSEFTVDGSESNLTGFEYIIIAVVGIGSVIVVVFIFIRKRGPNVQKVLKNHNQLNQEETEVIQFLAEKDGKAFEAEIREHFPQIPRTSLWRLVRRLEKLEIVEVKKIGLENQVILKK
ncbi:MAG: hypothetical protein NWF03_09100, partial [Candidatus Bathyarchaeota archaeon]|nr:hypothetical protein [Candidatus Bathyarchaeota archaeon]